MLFEKRSWAGIADGSITVAFRRWRRLAVVAGRDRRTPAGIIHVTAVDAVTPADVTDDDARAAGFPSAAALLADLPGATGDPLYRVRFRLADGPDPRAALASDADLTDDDVAAITVRLRRLERRGPWAHEVLRLIRDHPEVRAGDLADLLGRERLDFKLDVRKLKAIGLTESFAVGYRLSPRGAAYLARVS